MAVYSYETKMGKMWYVKHKNKTKRGFRKKSEAKLYEAKLKLEEKNQKSFMPFHKLIEDYLQTASKDVTFGTFKKTENVCRNIIIPNVDNKNLFDVDELDCRKFRDFVEGLHYSTEYKNYIIRTYKSLFNHAQKYFKLKYSPASVVASFKTTFGERMKKKEKEMRVWDLDDFNKFIQFVDKDKYKAFFITLFQTGMRLGEIQALTWHDFSDGCLNVNKSLTTKTKNEKYEIKEPKTVSSIRTISLGKCLNEFLIEFKECQSKLPGFDSNWFIFGGLEPLPATSINRIKDKAIKKAGVQRISIHEFRHSHASNLICSGMSIVAVSRRLGHSNIDMTLRTYTHLMRESEAQLVSFLDKYSQNILR